MKVIKELSVTVKYTVSISELEVSDEVYNQLVDANERGEEIDPSGSMSFPDASDWISSIVKEADSLYWSAEINEIE
jgi:hypothetical protein